KQKRGFFQIDFKTELIEKDELTNHVLPLELLVENGGVVSEERSRILISPVVKDALIGLRTSGIQNYNFNPRSGRKIEIEIPVVAEFKNHWDIGFSLDMSKDLLDDWNSLNEGDLLMAPAECFQLEGKTEIEAGKTERKMKIIIDREKMPYGDFAIPVLLTETSRFEINEDRNFLLLKLLNLQDKLDRSVWTLTPSSEQASNPVALMIDEDPATFWHSMYSPAPVPPMPYKIQIDFGGLHEVSAFDLQRRSDKFYNDLKSGSFEISENGEEWETVLVFEFPNVNMTTPSMFFFGKRNARYGRIIIDGSNRGANVSIAEFNVYGEKL
ncbi:MAG: discoidin domain-containing protein, partial [Bacteroidales bacterium]